MVLSFLHSRRALLSLLRTALLSVCLAAAAMGAASATPSTAPAVQTAPPLFHGNWCGLGDFGRRRPVDALDAACRAHDLCYERQGRGACSCDRAFVQATAALSQRRMIAEPIKAKAALANTVFVLAPCIETGKTRHTTRKR